MIVTWAWQSQPVAGQPWHTHSLNVDTTAALLDDDCDTVDLGKLAQMLAESLGLDHDTPAQVQERGPQRIAVWAGEDHAGEPDGTYGSIDALGDAADRPRHAHPFG